MRKQEWFGDEEDRLGVKADLDLKSGLESDEELLVLMIDLRRVAGKSGVPLTDDTLEMMMQEIGVEDVHPDVVHRIISLL